MAIGYIGLGNMGGALARRLLETHPLSVYDLDRAARDRLGAAGARRCETLADLVSRSDTIFICLPKSEHVREVIFGAGGLKSALRRDTLIVDQTTGHPDATCAMAADLTTIGVHLIDAPVSGGVQGAAAGTISIMVGASSAQFSRIEPLLKAISPNIHHAGDVGAGHAIKLVNNLVSGAQRLLTFEGMSLAAKNGIDPKRAAEILMSGGARNSFMEKFLLALVTDGKMTSRFSLDLMLKDVALACELARDSGVPVPFGEVARKIYEEARDTMGPDADVNMAAIRAERLAGTRLVPGDE
jgi:3-hydroxyisobutyrate dehydrogenase